MLIEDLKRVRKLGLPSLKTPVDFGPGLLKSPSSQFPTAQDDFRSAAHTSYHGSKFVTAAHSPTSAATN